MQGLGTLWQLQQIDLKLDDDLARMRGAEAQLGETEALLQARMRVSEGEARLKALRVQVRSWDLELQGLDSRIGQANERLYGGRVTNPKELAALQQDVGYLNRSKGELEDQMLEAMDQIEEQQPALEADQAELERIEAAWSANQQRARALIAELSKVIQGLQSQRQALAQTVPPGDLVLYEELRRRKAGQALAPLVDNRCSVCRVAVPSAKAQQVRGRVKIIQCDGCDRILVHLP